MFQSHVGFLSIIKEYIHLSRHCKVRVDKHPSGHRAVSARRPGVAGLRADVLQPRQPALAGAEGGDQATEVRKDIREETLHAF